MPTGIWNSRLRSGVAHCDLQLAKMKHEEYEEEEAGGGGSRRRRRRRRRARVTLIKSSNPHLAGGEQLGRCAY